MSLSERMALGLGAGLTMVLSACNSVNPDGAPPSVMKTAVDHPQGQRIFFQDAQHRYVVSLHDDGSYLIKTGDQSGVVLDKKSGQWSWKRSGTHEAVLGLDANEWRLTFIGPDDAMAVNPAGGGTKMFHFEQM